MVTYDISVLLGKDNPNKDVSIKRNDTGVNFRIRLKTAKRYSQWRTDEKDYMIPKDSTVILKIAKPDQTYVLVDGEESTSSAFFRIPKDSTAFAVAGTSKAEVSVYDENGRRITSATFNIEVTEECASDHEEDSSSYVDILADTINAINEAAYRAEAAAVNPPTISDDNTWMVWDFEKCEYIDTGVKATEPGPKGEKGEQGPKGDKGDPGEFDIEDGSVTTEKIADGAVTTAKIANSAVTNQQIARYAVDASKIWDKSVVHRCIGDKAVGRENIGDKAVGNKQIDDGSVTTDKLDDEVQDDIEEANATANEAKALAEEAHTKAETAEHIAKGANQAIVYDTEAEMLNRLPANVYEGLELPAGSTIVISCDELGEGILYGNLEINGENVIGYSSLSYKSNRSYVYYVVQETVKIESFMYWFESFDGAYSTNERCAWTTKTLDDNSIGNVLLAPNTIKVGTNLYIRELNVPDYWWDGTRPQPLETQKVNLTPIEDGLQSILNAINSIL